MILVEFDDGDATVIWVGDLTEYERNFKNNKGTNQKWLKSKNLI